MNIYIPGINNYTAMQGPCPDGFHIPLSSEWQAIYDAGITLGAWDSTGGTNFSKYMKIPFAGNRRHQHEIENQGTSGGLWSSSTSSQYASSIYFSSSKLNPQSLAYRSYGRFIRGLKDTPIIPTNSWTKLYGTSIESGGIFWDSTNGLISISSDGATWYTLQDKNIGATTVYNYGNTITVENTGNTFQWGNNYPFPSTYSSSSVTVSSSTVNANNYGPGNYYSSSTWIAVLSGWDSSQNDNLRGGETGIISPAELKNAYIGNGLS